MMRFREATKADIPAIQVVRNSVKENMLSNPALVSDKDCEDYMFVRGKGWVCEVNGSIVGFSIADLVDNNIWALFIHPDHEKKGIGKELHRLMMNWYFDQAKEFVWLSTAPKSRAESFYRKAGWTETGATKPGEIKFEMTAAQWRKAKPIS
jgi:GNAT superfamily N-acetyltransferase